MSVVSRKPQQLDGTGEAAPTASGQVEAARTAARQGDLAGARRLLRLAIQADASCVEAWVGLAWLAQTAGEREALLKRALELEPGNAKAQAELARLRSSALRGSTGPDSRHRRRWMWALLALPLALLAGALLAWRPALSDNNVRTVVSSAVARLLPTPMPTAVPTPTMTPAQIAAQFVPQLQTAIDSRSWDRAHDICAIMHSVDPSGEEVRSWTLITHMQHGRSLVAEGQPSRALAEFSQAAAVAPTDAEARRWRDLTQTYLDGVEALDSGDWPTAIESFGRVWQEEPGYADAVARLAEAYRRQGQAALDNGDWELTIASMAEARERLPEEPQFVDLLAQAYRERGIAEEKAGKLKQARADLEAALALRPGDATAKAHLEQVMLQLFPPKRIEINISTQRMLVYEGNKLLWTFVVSTGLRGRDTATGHYHVLDKIPMAYSAVWRLKMPYWLGIYYVGSVENGIHALPIRPDGTVMWGGLLGTRQSYGCVILSNEAARTLYNWAEIGTAVDIHY